MNKPLDLIDRAAAIAAVDREGGRLPDVGYKTGITSAMRVLEGVPAERADDDSLDAALSKLRAELPEYESRLEAIQAMPSLAAYDDFAQTLMFDLNATYAAAQYAERPRHEPDCPCEDCDIAASAG